MYQLLVVDDEPKVRWRVQHMVRGFDVAWDSIAADDGAQALEALDGGDANLVLADIRMPNMSGIECLQALRSSGSQVPFGFVTSEGSPEMREKAANAGAMFLIAKPFTEDTFKEHLDGVIA